MTIGIMGLGRMGMQIARRLHKKGFKVVAWNRSPGPRAAFKRFARRPRSGSTSVDSIPELIRRLPRPKILWLMLPAGGLVDEVLFGRSSTSSDTTKLSSLSLSKGLSRGDIVIDGGNSFYRDSVRRAEKLARHQIHFFDSGTSGGVWGERNGFSLMVGGPKKIWPKVRPIFRALAAGNGQNYGLVGGPGAGHFVKMVHNGIEYGMMEAIGEGMAVLKASPFKLDLKEAARIWSKGSVVSSWLIELTRRALLTENLDKVVGYIHHTGEGQWTIKEAKKLGVDVRVIADAFKVRLESSHSKNQKKFSNKIVSLLRKQFGGHEVTYKK